MTTFTLPPLTRSLPVLLLWLASLAFNTPAQAQIWTGDTALGIEVTDKKGKPVEGAEVLLLFVEREPFEGPSTVATDSKGFAQGLQLAQGRWRIDVKRAGYASYTVVVRIQPGKKPAITAGPIRDAVAPPMRVAFLKSPKVAQKASKKGRSPDRRKGKESVPTPPPVPSRPAPVTPPPPMKVPPPPVAPPAPPEPQMPEPQMPEPQMPEPAPKVPKIPEPEEAPAATAPPMKAPSMEAPPMEAPPMEAPSMEAPPMEAPPKGEPAIVKTPAPPVTTPAPKPEPTPAPPTVSKPAVQARPPAPPVQAPPPVKAPPVKAPPVKAPPVQAPPVQAPPSAAPPVVQPSVPVTRPSAPVPVEPPAPSPIAPVPTPEPSTSTSWVAQRREIRGFTDAACPNCKPGIWAMVVEQVASASTGGRGCPRNLEKLAPSLNAFADRIGHQLTDHPGPILELLDEGMKKELKRYLGPDAPCQLVAAPLPAGARFAGYAYEVRDAAGGGECKASQECSLQGSRWASHPVAYRNAAGTLVYALFENQSRERARTARLIVYFRPPPDSP